MGALHIDGADAEAVSLRVLDEHGGRVKAHGLVVEKAARESSEIVHLEIGRGVGDEREAGGVRLRETIHGE